MKIPHNEKGMMKENVKALIYEKLQLLDLLMKGSNVVETG
jgi:hypothetical protein